MRTTPIHDPDFWRSLNPHLTISDNPFTQQRKPQDFTRADALSFARQLRDEGYAQSPPVIDADALEPMRVGIERVVRAGFPSVFACVYDEFYGLFDGLSNIFEPLLGAGYLMVPLGMWPFFVDVGDAGQAGALSAVPPHRDLIGNDASVLAGEAPTIVNVWIPLTDATPSNSCIYVLPGNLDPNYRKPESPLDLGNMRLQDIRALPAQAGSVLAWSVHLLHWGSRSAPSASGPRMSVALYFQRRDVSRYHETAMEFPGPIPFPKRLDWIANSVDDAL